MSQLSEDIEPDADDVFQILLATDIHLGFAEDDAVRGSDTFETLKEILELASTNKVDFVLLGGDLFHHAQPSPYCIYKCMELLKKYCLGDRPVSIEFLSDPMQNFSQTVNRTVNYEDPNMNIELPVFSIHGNHDDPTGQKHTSSLDLLATSGLVNYFGRWTSFDQVEISPILLKKGNSKLALYGLSHIRDERLGRLFLDNKVKMLSPDNPDDWFHLLVWHQNRASRGTKNFIPDHTLPDFLDLVVWGHEHDCRIEPEKKPNGVHISQPGSSVATSLIAGESIPKKVGILKIHKKVFKIEPIELKTVRPFLYHEIIMKDTMQVDEDDEDSGVSPSEYSKQIVTAKLEELIKEAKRMGHTSKVSEQPLIRLIVRYKNERQVFNTIRFGQSYVGKVANPENMIKFQCLRDAVKKNKPQSNVREEEDEGPILAERVEDLVIQQFKDKEPLSLFALNSLNEAVKKYIDTNDLYAISDVSGHVMKDTLKQLEKDLPEIDETKQYIVNYKNKMETDAVDYVNKILNDPNRQNPTVARNVDASSSNSPTVARKANASSKRVNDEIIIDDDDDDDDDDGVDLQLFGTKKQSSRGRGAVRARAPRRPGRGRAAK